MALPFSVDYFSISRYYQSVERRGRYYIVGKQVATKMSIWLFLFSTTMISLNIFKRALGKVGKELTDTQVKELMDLQYGLADILFDAWQKKNKDVPQSVDTPVVIKHTKNGNFATIYTTDYFTYA